VVALGGGSVLSPRVREALADHVTLLLDVDPFVAWERVHSAGNGDERPLARDRESFMALAAERRTLYEQLADAVLAEPPPGGAPRALAALRALSSAPRGTRLLWARSASGEYPVFLGRGLLRARARGPSASATATSPGSTPGRSESSRRRSRSSLVRQARPSPPRSGYGRRWPPMG
jgi:hypothetical protein